jgi:glutamate dehydrogenase
VARIVRGWADELKQNLVGHYGEERGNSLLRRYSLEFAAVVSGAGHAGFGGVRPRAPRSRRAERPCRSQAERAQGDDGSHQHLKAVPPRRPRPLSAILPILENMGLTVLSEQPFSLPKSDLHIADFAVRLPTPAALDDESDAAILHRIARNLFRDQAENDGFNRLVLLAGLDGRQISILRAYSRYLRQAGLPFSQAYIERCLATPFPAITRAC